MKVSSLTFLTVSVVFLSLFGVVITANAQKKEIGINTVVIDAGHGGRDAGAVGRIYKEKDINLDVALRLGKMIGQKYPDVKVVYTRKTDVLIPLNERGNIANKAGADLFISIHINSNKSSAPSGTSTYVMGVDKAGKNLDVAMKENDVISYEDDYSTKYQGYVPGSPESFIIFSLIQSAYLSQSCTFADMVQKQFASQTKMQNRGVHQAGFLVLWSAAMPSILAEFGFISNPAEEKFVGSDKGRETYARCLFNAFSEYKVRSEGRRRGRFAAEERFRGGFRPGRAGNGRNGERHGRQRRGDRLPGSSRFGPAETAEEFVPFRALSRRGAGDRDRRHVQIFRRRHVVLPRSVIFANPGAQEYPGRIPGRIRRR